MSKHLIPTEAIENKIFIVRGRKAHSSARAGQKKHGPFSGGFYVAVEAQSLVSQNAIPSIRSLGGHLSYVFTEHGALMIASVLNTQRAVQVSIFVVRAFNKIREMLYNYKTLQNKIRQLEKKYDRKFRSVFFVLRKLLQLPREKHPKVKGFVGISES